MNHAQCKHCNGQITAGDSRCPSCGIPLLADQHKSPVKRFIIYFILLVIFCLFMIFWLPPDWAGLITGQAPAE